MTWNPKFGFTAYLKNQNMRYPYAIEATKDVPEWALLNKSSLSHLVML